MTRNRRERGEGQFGCLVGLVLLLIAGLLLLSGSWMGSALGLTLMLQNRIAQTARAAVCTCCAISRWWARCAAR